MDLQNINFDEYKFDPASYTIAVDILSEQMEVGCSETGSKTICKKFDATLSEKMEMYSQIAEEMKKVRVEICKIHRELESLKREQENLSSTNLDLKEVLKSTCKVTFVQKNEEFRTLTRKIQMSFGFKLKLVQCQDNQHQWIATFLYDVHSELESSHYVVILYNIEDESFTLRDMKPKHCRFKQFANFLANTNDVTGFLYNCWKYFSLTSSRN